MRINRRRSYGRHSTKFFSKLQAVAGAFLGVELNREDIIPRHRTGKGQAVFGGAGHQLALGRLHAIAVHEIEAAVRRRCRPTARCGFWRTWFQPMCGTFRRCCRRRRRSWPPESADAPAKMPRPATSPSLAVLEQHLQADADAEKGLVVGPPARSRRAQAAGVEFAHAVGHRALTRGRPRARRRRPRPDRR
jgi:hypothetical protein